ncbi:MAG: 2-oxo acid dehydrogenase subunit E2 [Nocardiaceae bacterium]|nr:2-oxo acid dehydrogenase subunit E2 [Nocardiaceae bacterium]
MIDFTMPSLGADMDEGRLNRWLIAPGEQVKRGQIVAEVETAKAVIEAECWHDGTVAELCVKEGEVVPVGTVLARLSETSGEMPRRPEVAAVAEPVEPAHPAEPVHPYVPAHPAAPVHPAAPPHPADNPQHRRWISPAARRKAEEIGVDLDSVVGTGVGGSVVIADVVNAAGRPAVPVQEEPVHEEPAPPAPKPLAPLTGPSMRSAIAAAMSRSKREIPHYYLAETVPVRRAIEWLADYNLDRDVTEQIVLACLEIKAVALAAQKYPEFSGYWVDEQLEIRSDVHVGVAVSLRTGGLVAPAIHDAASKDLATLMHGLTDVVRRARTGGLRASEFTDATITVTNLGDQGVESVFGVIYPPQVALVGFGSVTDRVLADDGAIRISPAVTVTLSADHRASDGHRGALFLSEIRTLLGDPALLNKPGKQGEPR